MTTFGGSTIPPIFINTFAGGGGIVTDIIVDNSGGTAQVAWAGNIFPINPNALRGHYRVGVRDGSGDNVVTDQNWAGEPPIDPPNYNFNVLNQVGDPADSGSNAWRAGFNTGCKSLNNGARWVVGSGVVVTRSISFTIEYQNAPAPDTCPGIGIAFSFNYTVTANFTG